MLTSATLVGATGLTAAAETEIGRMLLGMGPDLTRVGVGATFSLECCENGSTLPWLGCEGVTGVRGPSSPFSDDDAECVAVGDDDIQEPRRQLAPMAGPGEGKLKGRPDRVGST